jgi:hypothetical protein
MAIIGPARPPRVDLIHARLECARDMVSRYATHLAYVEGDDHRGVCLLRNQVDELTECVRLLRERSR